MVGREEEDYQSEKESSKDRSFGRRSILKGIAGFAGLSGLSHIASKSVRGAGSYNFTNTVDLSNHASPGSRIDSVLNDLASDNTLIEVPDATYTCGSIDFGGVDHFGIKAKDGASPTFKSPGSLSNNWFNYSGSNILLEGITFDHNGATEGTINLQMSGPWECRDVHHRGKLTTSAFRLAVTNSNATGLLKSCSAVDGGVDNDRSRGGFVPSEHDGELIIEDVDIRNFSDNGLYGSPGNGHVKVIRGFFKNNNISGVRVGMPATVQDTVVVNDGYAPSNSARNQRGIWLRDRGSGSVTVDNCDVTHTSGDDSHPILVEGGDGTVTNCRVRNDTSAAAINPGGSYTGSGNHITGTGNLSAPDSWVACRDSDCDEPRQTPREEAETDDDGGGSDLPHTLRIDGSNTDDVTNYTFTVDGELEGTSSLGSEDSVDGSTGSGSVWSGTDEYRFSGAFVSFELDGNATVYADGEEIDPNENGESSEAGQTLTIDGAGTDGGTDYTFSVDGELEGTSSLGAEDSVDGSTGSGSVWSGSDEYTFTGNLVTFDKTGDAAVYIDGEEIDPSEYGESSDPGQTLRIDGAGTDGGTNYTFSVDGDLSGTDSLNDRDTIEESTGSGVVYSGSDEYIFTGDIVSFQLDGDAAVLLDGQEIDLAQYGTGAAPNIDRYDVTEAGSRNPDVNITAVWNVSDSDGDLANVTVEVLDESGAVVDSTTTAVSGEQAYDVSYFKIQDVPDQSFDVQLRVTDSAGNTASDSESVQE